MAVAGAERRAEVMKRSIDLEEVWLVDIREKGMCMYLLYTIG